MQRTLLITHHFPPARGGAEQYLENLGRSFPKEQLIVVAPPMDGAAKYDGGSGIRVVRKDLLRQQAFLPGWIAHVPWLFDVVRKQRIARIIFGHYAAFVGLGLITRLVLGVPYTVSVFGVDFLAYRKTLLRRLLLRWNLRGAEWVTTISSHLVHQLRSFGVPEGKIVLAPPGIPDQPSASPASADFFRQRYGVGDRLLLLTVGRLVKRKGQSRVLRALPSVLAAIPELTYVIIGHGPERTSLERVRDSLNLGDHVLFLGSVPEREREAAYAAADAFIMLPSSTSSDVEGFGIVFLEALRAGKPIIATRSGGVSDIAKDGINGIALEEQAAAPEVATAIVRLMADKKLRTTLGRQGHDDVQKRFTLQQQIRPFHIITAELPHHVSTPPVVSIIIPAWNASETLAKTLHSIATQTFRDVETIVVDDGSTEDMSHILKRFPSVRPLRQGHAGASAARNRGFQESRGRYLLFCDADVTLHPRMLERMVTTLELKPEASYAYASFRFGWRTFDLFDFNAERLRRQNYISTMSLIRREAFPGFDESIDRLQDWDLWLTMLERGHRGAWVPSRLFSAALGKRAISKRITVPPIAAAQRIKEKHRLG